MRALILIVGTLGVLFSGAFAQRNAYQAEGEIGRLLADARSYYDNLELDAADRALNKAVTLGERFGVQSRALSEVYLQRGILVHVRDREADAAVAEFVKALKIDRTVLLDPMVSTPSLNRLFKQAQAQVGAAAPPPVEPQAGTPAPPPVGRHGVRHAPIERAIVGKPLTIKVQLTDRLNAHAYRVNLLYRSARVDSVQRLEMSPKGPNTFQAIIPEHDMASGQIAYFIQVEDRARRVIGAFKSSRTPQVVVIEAIAGLTDMPSGTSLDGGSADESWLNGDGTSRKYVSLTLSIGTGGGLITDLAEPVKQDNATIEPGFAVSPFHTLVEFDLWITEWMAMSAFARIQVVEFAHLEGGRFKFRVMNDGGQQLHLRLGGGVGQVRHLVDLGQVLDTTLEGPYHYTVGLSYLFNISDTYAFAITPDFYHLIGDSPAYHIDLNVGFQASF